MLPDVLIHHLKRARFEKIIGEDHWRAAAPLYFAAVADQGEFTVLVCMTCGCAMAAFYKRMNVAMADGSKAEALTCSLATPKDWDESCPVAFLPESAAEKPVFQLAVPWSHKSVRPAVERYEARMAAQAAAENKNGGGAT